MSASSYFDGEDVRGYSAGGDDSDEVVILGESTTRSESPYDPAIHTMEETCRGAQLVPCARQACPRGWRRRGGMGAS